MASDGDYASGSAYLRSDYWRCGPAQWSREAGYKEWSYFCIATDAFDLLLNFSLLDRQSQTTAEIVATPRLLALMRENGSWSGDIEEFSTAETGVAAGNLPARVGPSRIDFVGGCYRLTVAMPGLGLSADLSLQPLANPAANPLFFSVANDEDLITVLSAHDATGVPATSRVLDVKARRHRRSRNFQVTRHPGTAVDETLIVATKTAARIRVPQPIPGRRYHLDAKLGASGPGPVTILATDTTKLDNLGTALSTHLGSDLWEVTWDALQQELLIVRIIATTVFVAFGEAADETIRIGKSFVVHIKDNVGTWHPARVNAIAGTDAKTIAKQMVDALRAPTNIPADLIEVTYDETLWYLEIHSVAPAGVPIQMHEYRFMKSNLGTPIHLELSGLTLVNEADCMPLENSTKFLINLAKQWQHRPGVRPKGRDQALSGEHGEDSEVFLHT